MPSVENRLYEEQYLAKKGQNDLIWTVTTLILQPAQIRTLNSQPVNIVVPKNSRTFLAPGQCVFVGAQGNGAYSGAPGPILQYSDASHNVGIDFESWDGSAATVGMLPDVSVNGNFYGANGDFAIAQVGLALQITSGGDVTGGDAPCTIILTWRPYLVG